jgi:ribonucleoside-diphosphate reductase alpha chain
MKPKILKPDLTIEEINTTINSFPEPYVSDNAQKVLENRYLKREKGTTAETPKEMYFRVATAIASVEKESIKHHWLKEFYNIMAFGEMLPNSPTLMNAGNKEGKQMCSACFVLEVDDTMESIMGTMKDTAMTQKLGGGTGFSFNKLRPSGSYISGSGGTTSGPLSFIDAYSATTTAIQQGAYRRGANMGILGINHPDIIDFINAKSDLKRWQNYNVSIAITNDFMDLVEGDPETSHRVDHEKWGTGTLYFNQDTGDIRAIRDTDDRLEGYEPWTVGKTWSLICNRAWTTGEPGLLFIDRVNEDNPVEASLGLIEATNPCGEEPMHSGDSCTLGAINVNKFFRKGYSKAFIKDFDEDAFRKAIRTTTRFLDNVLQINDYPIELMKTVSEQTRRIGVGVMGFADLLFRMKIRYGSDESLVVSTKLSRILEEETLRYSEELGEEKGHFGLCEESSVRTPRRNSFLRTIAPTGTISIIGDCSGGIEPKYSLCTLRQVMADSDGKHLIMTEFDQEFLDAVEDISMGLPTKKEIIEHVKEFGNLTNYPDNNIKEIMELKEIFVVAEEVKPLQHVNIQAAWQEHIDAGISKTINMPKSSTVEEVEDAYLWAYGTECKGVTVYRDGCRDSAGMTQPMSSGTSKEETSAVPEPAVFDQDFAPAVRTKIPTQWGNVHLMIVSDSNGKEMEIFAQLGKAGDLITADIEGLCRVASLYLREGGTIDQIIKQWEDIGSSHATMPGPHGKITSLPDALAKGLKMYSSRNEIAPKKTSKRKDELDTAYAAKCPQCSSKMIFTEGCKKCSSCSYSAC